MAAEIGGGTTSEKKGTPSSTKHKLGDKIRQTKHDPKNVPDPGFMT